jgi:hypothetical protein
MTEPASGWDRHADEQRRAWLLLSYAERLRWLEQAKQFSEMALGAARRRSAVRADDGHSASGSAGPTPSTSRP